MNLFKIISDIEKVDPEVYERLDGRRAAFRYLSGFGKKAAAAAIPAALATVFTKAYGQSGTNVQVLDVLNYALKLEYLESEFYKMATGSTSTLAFPTPAARTAIETIRDHEAAHVAALKGTIMSLGGTPVDMPTFDFSGGKGSGTGSFANAFSDYGLFLTVAQAFEDTGVRAYKGRAAELMGNATVLRAALSIHSVEARHASHIRQMRKAAGVADVKPWITGNNANGVPVAAIYAGEENATQAGVAIGGFSGISADAATEAFDEPLTPAQVLAIIDPFLA